MAKTKPKTYQGQQDRQYPEMTRYHEGPHFAQGDRIVIQERHTGAIRHAKIMCVSTDIRFREEWIYAYMGLETGQGSFIIDENNDLHSAMLDSVAWLPWHPTNEHGQENTDITFYRAACR